MGCGHSEPPSEVSLFTDGSSFSLRGMRHGASAVVMIVQTAHKDFFGGFRCFSLFDGATAPRAEMAAILSALLWVAQILDKWHDTITDVTFGFDCLAGGMPASGQWQINDNHDIQKPSRSIVHWLNWEHIPAHAGHPWNEAADADAASWATFESMDCSHTIPSHS